MKRGFAALAAAALLAACGGGEGEGGLTAEDNDELNEAAAMLDDNATIDASPDSLVAGEDLLGNGEEPAVTGDVPATEPVENAAQ